MYITDNLAVLTVKYSIKSPNIEYPHVEESIIELPSME